MTKLTGQERVSRAFERRDHDRVPGHESFWGETIERWQKEGLNGDARTVLDSKKRGRSWATRSRWWRWPKTPTGCATCRRRSPT